MDTCWKSTFLTLQCLYELREPVGAPLALLKTDTPPTAPDYKNIKDALSVLEPFHQATVEVSAEKRVLPLIKMLHHAVTCKVQNITTNMSGQLGDTLIRHLEEHSYHLESASALTMPTLLDPRFKQLGFVSQAKIQEAVIRLKKACVTLMRADASDPVIVES